MRRGTTRPITCTVDRDFTNYPVVELTLTDGHYKLTFNKSELTITPSTVVVSLTQEQALLFSIRRKQFYLRNLHRHYREAQRVGKLLELLFVNWTTNCTLWIYP